MSRRESRSSHAFQDKLLLNQWLISLFGIDPFVEHKWNGKTVHPFQVMTVPLISPELEGLDQDNIHKFYHALVNSSLFWEAECTLGKDELLGYETNIARHTMAINVDRQQPVVWKYYQWLTLLFVEIYLDRYFGNREKLLDDLNSFVSQFNFKWANYIDIPGYCADDLNKLCIQSATGSGKTLVMHVNLLQFSHYAKKYGRDKELSRVILITPNERLSEQHISEFEKSSIYAGQFMRGNLHRTASVDVLEITKLADQEGPNTIETRSLGDQNLLLVDEGHRGMSGKEEGAWLSRRSQLCEKGFVFEYSATFAQAVASSKRADFENSYAKAVIFDYSYRWFYGDGYGKDYRVLNLPKSYAEVKSAYLTACLLMYYQQLRIYQEMKGSFIPYNIEKPLWIFVGNTVSSASGTRDEKLVATDVAQIVQFIAEFLADRTSACRRIREILMGRGQDTGLIDKDGGDIFSGTFNYLAGETGVGDIDALHADILERMFNCPGGGILVLERVLGTGEIILRAGAAESPFGLISVGDAKGLCDHIAEMATDSELPLVVQDSEFAQSVFPSVKDSSSPINLLVGAKKFIEGWDCWRVSTMGLMHVGKKEGTQIIQLFGRGVRLKGYQWSLKRSGYSNPAHRPRFIEELETLHVFGIEADFMERFSDYLKEEGLPGNEQKRIITVPLNITYNFGKRLKILRPKKKDSDGKEYDFKTDAPVPVIGVPPKYFSSQPIICDWYPRIQIMQSRGTVAETAKDKVDLRGYLELLDFDALYFEIEQLKRDRGWHNLIVSKQGIRDLLWDYSWYELYIPMARLTPDSFKGISLLQQVSAELARIYCERYYNYCKREYLEPRLEYRELMPDDGNIPGDNNYQLIVDGNEEQVIQGILHLKQEIETQKEDLLQASELKACNFGVHLFQPLFHVRTGGKISVLPVSLNESEYQFVTDLKQWCQDNKKILAKDKMELFLLRNLSRGKGVGFFEAGNFYPDFILWILTPGRQYVNFLEPHGLLQEGPGSDKILFYQRIKEVEKRLNDPAIVLNSYILSWTECSRLNWGLSREELEKRHILFMHDDKGGYIEKLRNDAIPLLSK